MGNCLNGSSSDDLTLLNGRSNDNNGESMDHEASAPVSSNFVIISIKKICVILPLFRDQQLFCVLTAETDFDFKDFKEVSWPQKSNADF